MEKNDEFIRYSMKLIFYIKCPKSLAMKELAIEKVKMKMILYLNQKLQINK